MEAQVPNVLPSSADTAPAVPPLIQMLRDHKPNSVMTRAVRRDPSILNLTDSKGTKLFQSEILSAQCRGFTLVFSRTKTPLGGRPVFLLCVDFFVRLTLISVSNN